MEQLKTSYRKNDFDYTLIERNDHVAMFQQHRSGSHVAYEVGYIKIEPETTFPNGVTLPEREAFWGNEDFGRMAWTLISEERARERFAMLTANPRSGRHASGDDSSTDGSVQ